MPPNPYPRVCAGCGGKVKFTGDLPLWFETIVGGPPLTWHIQCRLRKQAA